MIIIITIMKFREVTIIENKRKNWDPKVCLPHTIWKRVQLMNWAIGFLAKLYDNKSKEKLCTFSFGKFVIIDKERGNENEKLAPVF